MPTATYIALANITLTSSQATVVFSNIPTTYRDLILVGDITPDGNIGYYLRVNGDTGSNYSAVVMSGNSFNTTASTTQSGTFAQVGIYYVSNANRQNIISHFMDYSATDKHKTILTRTGHPNEVVATAARWASTTAINSITLSGQQNFSTNSFASGSTFALYGIVS